MRNKLVCMLSALTVCSVAPAAAQSLPLSVEVRGGAAVPFSDLSDDGMFDAETGWGFDVTGALDLTPMIALYAGWSRYAFPANESVFSSDAEYIDSGLNAGVKLSPAFAPFGLVPWLRGGAVYHDFEIDFEGEETTDDFERALGFEVGGGLEVPLGQVVSITPGVRYVRYSTEEESEIEGGGIDTAPEFDISSLAVEFGLSFRF